MASLSEPLRNSTEKKRMRCLACGKVLGSALSFAGSLRCHDCREANSELDPELVERWQRRGAQF